MIGAASMSASCSSSSVASERPAAGKDRDLLSGVQDFGRPPQIVVRRTWRAAAHKRSETWLAMFRSLTRLGFSDWKSTGNVRQRNAATT